MLICDLVVNGDLENQLVLFDNPSLHQLYKIYFPIFEADRFRLIFADIAEKKLFYVDPRVDTSLPETTRAVVDGIHADRAKYGLLVREFLRRFEDRFYPVEEGVEPVPEEMRWRCTQFPEYKEGVVYFEPLKYLHDSSIYILHYMDFDMNDVLPIFFRSDIQRVRVNTAFSFLRGSFQL